MDSLFARIRSEDELLDICEYEDDVILNLFREDDPEVVRIFCHSDRDPPDCNITYVVYKYRHKYFYLVAINDDLSSDWRCYMTLILKGIKREIEATESIYDIAIVMLKWQDANKDIHIDWNDVVERAGGDKDMLSKVMELQATHLAEADKRARQAAKEREANIYTDIVDTIAFFEAGPQGDPFFTEKRLAQQRSLAYNIRQVANEELRNILEEKARKYL